MNDPQAAQRLCAPAAERNAAPILEVLRGALPAQGTVLEIASGTGQHAVHFASALPGLTWQPSDADARARASIAARCLMKGAGARVAAGGALVLYGPYRRGGAHTAPSNEAFDADLRARDPSWGVRDMEDVEALAEAQGFACEARVAMPANNFSLVFRKR